MTQEHEWSFKFCDRCGETFEEDVHLFKRNSEQQGFDRVCDDCITEEEQTGIDALIDFFDPDTYDDKE